MLHTIDLEREADLAEVLLRDKHTRIEGLCTENFFKEELINNNFDNSSSSWWFVLKPYGYAISKFIQSLHELTSSDIELLEHFSKFNRHVFVITFCRIEKTFFFSKFRHGEGTKVITNWNKTKRCLQKNLKKALIPQANERDQPRLKIAIEYLKKRNLLRSCVLERIFANCWLGNTACWDIDSLVKYKGKFLAFEVKQKFPSSTGTWGLNSGLANLFKYLNTINIHVIHVILTKPLKDAGLSAIDLYTKPEYKKESKWIAIKFSHTLLSRAQLIAPARTSIHGTSPISYYDLQPDLFSHIKSVSSSSNTMKEYLHNNF